MLKVGKLFQDSRRQMDLCFWNGGAEKCFERKRHGCGGDGDEDNCQTRQYVKVERLEEAKADSSDPKPSAENPTESIATKPAYKPKFNMKNIKPKEGE